MTDKAVKKTTPAGAEGEGPGTGADDTSATGELVAQAQSPALEGATDVEIAQRSQDVDADTSSEHIKVFVVQKKAGGSAEDMTGDEDMHARNIDAMRQAMVLQGLRPLEDGRFVSAEDHPDGQSVCLTYAVACVPAAVATPEQSEVRITVADQHKLDKQRAQGQEG